MTRNDRISTLQTVIPQLTNLKGDEVIDAIDGAPSALEEVIDILQSELNYLISEHYDTDAREGEILRNAEFLGG